MRFLLIFLAAAATVAAQSPSAQIINISRPGKTDFQAGDHFRIVITGASNQPVSVRTTRMSHTDWGPVIGQTDANGWSVTGQFDKSGFGDWSEAWTVGGKLANPVINFSVRAPCLPGAEGGIMYLGAAMVETCRTKDGAQTFATPNDGDSFHTPDGRVVPGRDRSSMTAEQYRMSRLESLIVSDQSDQSSGLYGDEVATLITKMIGVNALSEREMQNAVRLIHRAYERPKFIPQAVHVPTVTLPLLKRLANATQQESLKQQIAETINYVQLQ